MDDICQVFPSIQKLKPRWVAEMWLQISAQTSAYPESRAQPSFIMFSPVSVAFSKYYFKTQLIRKISLKLQSKTRHLVSFEFGLSPEWYNWGGGSYDLYCKALAKGGWEKCHSLASHQAEKFHNFATPLKIQTFVPRSTTCRFWITIVMIIIKL